MFQILDETEAGRVITTAFHGRAEGYITALERQEIVCICVHHLTSLPSGYYPTAELKNKMAASIVSGFPCLAYNADGVSPHCHFYNPHTPGFIDQRLKTIRRVLQPNERRKRISSPQQAPRQMNIRRGCQLRTE